MDVDVIRLDLLLVGGPFDSEPGLWWADDGEHPPPAQILVGVCPGTGVCGHPACAELAAGGQRHVSFWDVQEDWPAIKLTQYVRLEVEQLADQLGRVRYLHDTVDVETYWESHACRRPTVAAFQTHFAGARARWRDYVARTTEE